jgi:hypothetical protein
MLCGRCEALAVVESARRVAGSPARVWGVERLGDLLCSGCGTILGVEDIAQRLLQKQSQLAQFGLAGPARPLLGSARGEGS